MASKWIKIGKGPLLNAGSVYLDAFNSHPDIKGSYRVGEERWESGIRKMEIIADNEEVAQKVGAVASVIKLGIP